MDMENDSNSLENVKWRCIWKLRVPPKFRNFLWRVGRDCLPTRANLCKRGVHVYPSCVILGLGIENSWHTLVNCNFAEQCWQKVGLHSVIYSIALVSESVTEWMFKVLGKLQKPYTERFSMVAWAIWKQRNNQLWNASHLPPRNTIIGALNTLLEWIAVKAHGTKDASNPLRNNECELWHTPPSSYVKCNIDVVFPNEARITGLGIVLRSDSGEFIGCRFSIFHGRMSVNEGETMSLLEACCWVRNMGVQKVVFESDSESVVDAVRSSKMDLTEFAAIIAKCNNSW